MVLDFKIYSNIVFDCKETILSSLAEWYGYEWRYMFINSLGFKFGNSKRKTLGHRLKPLKGDVNLSLSFYGGIKVKKEKIKSSELYDYIRNEIMNNSPIILKTDIFYCSWFKQYKCYKSPHLLTIIGINNDDSLVCLDNKVTNKLNETSIMTKDDFISGYDSFYKLFFIKNKNRYLQWPYFVTESVLCSICRINPNSIYFYKKIFPCHVIINVLKFYSKLVKRTFYSDIREFARELEGSSSLIKEISGDLPISENALFKSLNQIVRGRQQFSITLEYLSEKTGREDLSEMAKKFYKISYEWRESLYFIVEYLKYGDINHLRKASDKLIDISYNEEKIISELIGITTNQIKQIEIPVGNNS